MSSLYPKEPKKGLLILAIRFECVITPNLCIKNCLINRADDMKQIKQSIAYSNKGITSQGMLLKFSVFDARKTLI